MIKKILNYIFKVATCILIAIILEGVGTMGQAFYFQNYTIIAWIAQACILVIIFRIAALDWN